MRKIAIYSVAFLLAINSSLCQEICDENKCTATKEDLTKGTQTANSLTVQSKAKRELQIKSGVGLPRNCEYPTFWKYDRNGNLAIHEAKSTGTAVDVDRRDSVILLQQGMTPLWMPITYQGEPQYVAIGYNGDAFFIDLDFIFILTEPKYWCKGLPKTPTKYIKCACGSTYKVQEFRARIGGKYVDETIVINGRGCSKYKNGNHDNMELYKIQECECIDGIKSTKVNPQLPNE